MVCAVVKRSKGLLLNPDKTRSGWADGVVCETSPPLPDWSYSLVQNPLVPFNQAVIAFTSKSFPAKPKSCS